MIEHIIEQYGMMNPVKIRQGHDYNDFELPDITWVCLEDIVEALKSPKVWRDSSEAFWIAELLEGTILDA